MWAPIVNDTQFATAAVAVLAVLAGVVALFFVVRGRLHRTLVIRSSVALQELHELNLKAQPYVAQQETIKSRFAVRVESKGKFDRFDLDRFLRDSAMDHEAWYESEIASRVRALELHTRYQVSVERIADRLGASRHRRLRGERYSVIEKRLFDRRQLERPAPSARVVAEVKYTSPQGRNSYSRRLEWNFDELCDGLRSAQDIQARRSTAEALRARERSLMTSRLRVSILRRDDYRCKMCGASRDEGVNLHVDHIVPVSRGGRTLPENLQTLCQPCNLGKSNRFIG